MGSRNIQGFVLIRAVLFLFQNKQKLHVAQTVPTIEIKETKIKMISRLSNGGGVVKKSLVSSKICVFSTLTQFEFSLFSFYPLTRLYTIYLVGSTQLSQIYHCSDIAKAFC